MPENSCIFCGSCGAGKKYESLDPVTKEKIGMYCGDAEKSVQCICYDISATNEALEKAKPKKGDHVVTAERIESAKSDIFLKCILGNRENVEANISANLGLGRKLEGISDEGSRFARLRRSLVDAYLMGYDAAAAHMTTENLGGYYTLKERLAKDFLAKINGAKDDGERLDQMMNFGVQSVRLDKYFAEDTFY